MISQHAALLAAHGIDLDDALARLDGNAGLYERVMMRYRDDAHFAGLEAALDDGDCEAAHREAHALKGLAGNLSFAALHLAATALDDEAREGRLDAARALFPAVRDAHRSVLHALETVAETR